MKLCIKCKLEKDYDSFNRDKRNKDDKSNICRSCKKKLDRVSYLKRRDKILITKRNKMLLYKVDYFSLKSNISCEKCGDGRIYVLDFHHIDSSQKKFNIGTEAWRQRNIDEIKKEIEKCVVLCSNCHREFHFLEKKNGIKVRDFLNAVT